MAVPSKVFKENVIKTNPPHKANSIPTVGEFCFSLRISLRINTCSDDCCRRAGADVRRSIMNMNK